MQRSRFRKSRCLPLWGVCGLGGKPHAAQQVLVAGVGAEGSKLRPYLEVSQLWVSYLVSLFQPREGFVLLAEAPEIIPIDAGETKLCSRFFFNVARIFFASSFLPATA